MMDNKNVCVMLWLSRLGFYWKLFPLESPLDLYKRSGRIAQDMICRVLQLQIVLRNLALSAEKYKPDVKTIWLSKIKNKMHTIPTQRM